MKYYYYKIINDICNSISEAVNYMISTDSDMLLENCLESLSSVRKILNQNKESLENDDIFLILDSIESQFKIFSEITIYDKLICDIDRLKEECINGIKYKIRVLFVAELGGKWDAMASVYEALKKRDDCIVDVVLQPVFRSITLPDGKNKTEVVYNDWLTEKGINHISYEQYDLAEMQPDITFTSQPYDSCAIPKFWAKNIAKYSRLVYLPYFAAVTFNEISSAFNSFFKLTTQKYSWRIACQSERMKNYYEQYGSRKGENVIASGLPKWDYPLKLDATNTPMPEEWKRKLAGKTVILWNTHFSTELCGSMILTKKVFEFLEIFQNNPDIALIWRPHPMMDTVIKVYHSESEIKFYKSLKEYVRNSDNMVIDEGGPYDAAFLYSDALISDFSTLMEQYLFMDKPVLMLTKNDISEELDRLCDGSNLSDYSKLRFANTIEMQKDFINDVLNGDMSWKANQDYILNNFFYNPNADCGQRFADQIIEEFKKEVLLPPRKTEVLIIGSIKDSIPCLKSLSELNYDYHICDMLLCKDDNIQSSFNINEITQFEYKCIVITQKKPNEVAFIKDILINDYNIDNNKIVEFWHIYNACIPTMVVDRVMSNPKHNEYDGMILGLSHTETGIRACGQKVGRKECTNQCTVTSNERKRLRHICEHSQSVKRCECSDTPVQRNSTSGFMSTSKTGNCIKKGSNLSAYTIPKKKKLPQFSFIMIIRVAIKMPQINLDTHHRPSLDCG